VAGRIAGWPKVVPKGPDGKPDPAALETMRYYDSVNFATRVKAPAHVEVGFQDVICPPTSAYAAYNSIPGKKEMVNDPTHGHDLGPRVWSDMRKLVLAHIAEQAKAPAAQ
jgi:cephalosporin-C deacetylase-like acetyl esterase